MYQLILVIHIIIAFLIVGLVLVQQGKGATMGAGFGSGASQTVFGSRGSGSFLFRLTLGIAGVFFLTSLALNSLATHSYKQEKTMMMPLSIQKNANSHAPVAAPAMPVEQPKQ